MYQDSEREANRLWRSKTRIRPTTMGALGTEPIQHKG